MNKPQDDIQDFVFEFYFFHFLDEPNLVTITNICSL